MPTTQNLSELENEWMNDPITFDDLSNAYLHHVFDLELDQS